MADKEKKPLNKKIIGNLIVIIAILTVIATGLVSVGMYSVFMLFLGGMLPGIVAYIVDQRDGKFASKTVFAFNLSGLLPQLAAAFNSGTPDSTAHALLTNPFTWLLPYGFAAFGWGMVFILPQISLTFLNIKAEFMIKKLEQYQKKLVNEWGDKILPKK